MSNSHTQNPDTKKIKKISIYDSCNAKATPQKQISNYSHQAMQTTFQKLKMALHVSEVFWMIQLQFAERNSFTELLSSAETAWV